ncbi:uncharacterized protein BN499_03005 [Blautia hydrogenotrophica CAG:147]|uniref:polysaccharide pyruvyl transferase family protein n=1 Tax=Blautia hydrogenotrophica TaxID=53443 RepID=UPI0003400AEF|nr:polysaccharide pyruvyl transferase family protein [Blautia hydrogenotrophica]CCX59779.1 uncharacterized protein BN499_03005 [Blautia hydrogenotrophica CAG:147]
MGKIGICACYDTFNYGSMLQTMATLKQLEIMGYEYEIINYSRKLTVDLLFRSIGRIPEELHERIIKKKKQKQMSAHPNIKVAIQQRNSCFKDFIETHFVDKLSEPCDTYKQLQIIATHYDAVLVGSDQLWTPRGYSTGFYNLMFVPDEIPKLAYATSFGVSSIPENKKGIAKRFLNRMNYISVRELCASEIVNELTGRDVPTVVDPTLLFSGDEWKKMVGERHILNYKYIFCYFLGNNPEQRREVEKLQQETGYKIVCIPHLDEFIEEDVEFGDEQLFNVGPAEFVNLIRHAEYICTDSFHGSVFSILNHKQFITFNRFKASDTNSRNSRIDSLFKQTDLQDRRFNGNLIDSIQCPIAYEQVEDSLIEMRKKSLDYLEKALGNTVK